MTPLAYRIIKELTLPLKDRTFHDGAGLLKRMDDIHCFDFSDVFHLLDDLSQRAARDFISGGREVFGREYLFLPAPKTWIECKDQNGDRWGILLRERNGIAFVDCAVSKPFACAVNKRIGILPLGEDARLSALPIDLGESYENAVYTTSIIYTALALINSPRVIGRRQHMPHRGLERRLVAQRGILGKFPLHAWTEIKLEVTAPKDASGDKSQEAHYTGERALHFCRAHLRIRCGRLEVVRGHWRGDASLGIRQSRYKLSA